MAWRSFVLAVMLGVGSYALHSGDTLRRVDTDAMLDVSVSIKTISHVRIDQVGDSVWESGSGSGFLVSADGCEVWTNHHVIADAALIEVYPRGWNRAAGIQATVINSTPRNDIAILRLEDCSGIPQAVLGNSDLVQPGDETFAVGNPLGRNPDSISRGIISHTQRYRDSTTPYLQTDAAINPGNSGGALFDRNGKVIGINTAIDSTRYGTNLGIGFAVPINQVMQTVADLRHGPPSWGDAGFSGIVSTLTPDEAEVLQVPGGGGALVVTKTPDNGPSQGRLEAHDVIYRINETEIRDTAQAVRLVGQYEVGDILSLDLIRAGEPMEVEIVLGEGWQGDSDPAPDNYDGFLGLTLEMWGDADGDRGQFKKPVITKVHSLGPAHRAHIASSQRSVVVNGPYVIPYLLDVKTVTGVAYQGKLHSIASVEEIEDFARRAYQDRKPLLLEIEYWARRNPQNHKTDLELASTAFFKIMPQRAIAEVTNPQFRKVMRRDRSRPPFEFSRGQAGSRNI